MVRRLEAGDKETYIELAGKFYASEAVLHPIPSVYIENTWEEMMRSEEYVNGYLLENGGEAAGYALTSKTFSQEAGGIVIWLEELFVLPQYRSCGLGKEFFAYLDEHIAAGASRVRLEIEPDNIRARKLYQSLGYEELNYQQMVKEINKQEDRA